MFTEKALNNIDCSGGGEGLRKGDEESPRETGNIILTLSTASTSAYLLRSVLTTSRWPSREAEMSTVSPSWKQHSNRQAIAAEKSCDNQVLAIS